MFDESSIDKRLAIAMAMEMASLWYKGRRSMYLPSYRVHLLTYHNKGKPPVLDLQESDGHGSPSLIPQACQASNGTHAVMGAPSLCFCWFAKRVG